MSTAGSVDRVAIVTGAARGIGAATTRLLCARGWRVLAVDSCADDPAVPYAMGTRAELDAVVDSTEGEAAAFVADVRDAAALGAAVAAATSRWGGLDAAIAGAGVIGGGVAPWELEESTERAVVDICLGGVLNLARVAVPALLARPEPRSGRFVAIASAAASRGMYHLAAYCAAKAGVVGAVRALAVDLASSGITVNAVSPGSTNTSILDESARLYELVGAEAFALQQPLGRLVRAEEIAAAIGYLVGDDAAAVTGADLAVDGGLAL